MNGVTENIKFKTKESEKKASKLNFTERQATAILEMRLYKLAGVRCPKGTCDAGIRPLYKANEGIRFAACGTAENTAVSVTIRNMCAGAACTGSQKPPLNTDKSRRKLPPTLWHGRLILIIWSPG